MSEEIKGIGHVYTDREPADGLTPDQIDAAITADRLQYERYLDEAEKWELCECGRKPEECATFDGAERHGDR
jgi:hypothetical protein